MVLEIRIYMLLKQILNKLRFKTSEKRLLPVILAGIDAIAKFNQIFGLKIKILEIEKLIFNGINDAKS